MKVKPQLHKGTRDFGPKQVARRQYIISAMKEAYELFGFQPIETPAIEKMTTLSGKYGEEGDALLFKILNSGDFLKKVNETDLQNRESKKIVSAICEKGLRYDLTVPFARFVVMNRNDLSFPFKRYQIQPVWRADRPQKGRYQEFFQCDADIIGSDSLLNEVELIQIIDRVFTELQLENIDVQLNNRKILEGISEIVGAAAHFVDITVAIDKLDKIGIEKVNEELVNRGISPESVEKLQTFLELEGTNDEKLSFLEEKLANSETGMKGVEEMQTIFDYLQSADISSKITFDLTLARGLSYYTGTIIEVVPIGTDMKSSIAGGGRYDDLTSIFGLKDVSGVGFSFGLDRIYDVMEELNLFDDIPLNLTRLLFISFDEVAQDFTFQALQQVRKSGIPSEMFPEPATNGKKIKKQMNYANNRNIPYVVLVGSNEVESGLLSFKNMATGDQKQMSIDKIIEQLKFA